MNRRDECFQIGDANTPEEVLSRHLGGSGKQLCKECEEPTWSADLEDGICYWCRTEPPDDDQ